MHMNSELEQMLASKQFSTLALQMLERRLSSCVDRAEKAERQRDALLRALNRLLHTPGSYGVLSCYDWQGPERGWECMWCDRATGQPHRDNCPMAEAEAAIANMEDNA